MGYAEIKLEISGDNTIKNLDNESGGHRIQRIPPTERNGRVHTSTVTVAVLDDHITTDERFNLIDDKHFRVEWYSGTGNGGQNRNKVQACCRLIHIPTGVVETRQGRSRDSNYKECKIAIIEKLKDAKKQQYYSQQSHIRKEMVGSGMRGDKRRTYRFQDDIVNDHILNKRASCTEIMRGKFEKLWE
jgi:peptide chain release factor 1